MRGLAAVGVAWFAAACGADDVNLQQANPPPGTGGGQSETGGASPGGAGGGGAGGTAGTAGGPSGGSGGVEGGVAGAGGGGAGGVAGAGGGGGAGGVPPCAAGSGRCNGDVPELCEGGQWVPKPACAAPTPACSNGVCGTFKVSGGIVTVANGVLKNTTIRLVEHGLEYQPTSCGGVGAARVCVTGGIRP
jgi:hypothetical protein